MAIRTLADAAAAETNGRTWLGFYRRGGPAIAVGVFSDLSYAAGIPVANYYAATPLVSATLATTDGIDLGPAPATGMTKYLRSATLLPPVACGVMAFEALDVVMFYPFVDGDGGDQLLTNTVTMPRYNGGEGCRIMVVSQGAGTGVVNANIYYTNCAGVPAMVNVDLNLAATAGQLCSSFATGASNFPAGAYLPLAVGCKGVRSIDRVEYLAGGGGIAAFVIVKHIASLSMFEATTAPIEVDFAADRSFKLPELPVGTYLSLIARGTTASTPATISGVFKTIWG